jgi:hypothetical protein
VALDPAEDKAAIEVAVGALEQPPSPDAAAQTSSPTSSQVFAYAAFLPPGLHQFLIYCPETHRAFCKQVVIDVNGRDFFPEYPCTLNRVKRKPKIKRKNVWAAW